MLYPAEGNCILCVQQEYDDQAGRKEAAIYFDNAV